VIGSQYETGMPRPNRQLSTEILYIAEKEYNHRAKVFSGNVLRYREAVINTTL
jgi:hypothetical protein